MKSRARHGTILTITLFLNILQISHQFASMLVERQSSCWIFVRDTSEVVMNNKIKAFENSSHPNVSIELFDQNNNPIAETLEEGSGRRIVYINDELKNKENQFGQDQKSTKKFVAKLKFDDDLKDIQFAMDIKITPELDDDQIKLSGDETRMQARFTSPLKGCNDYRASGRGRDHDGLTFEVLVPSSVYMLNDMSDHSVDLVAVWACGHEAITLTKSIVFIPRSSNAPIEGTETGDSTANDIDVPKAHDNRSGHDHVENLNHTITVEDPLTEDSPNGSIGEHQAGERLSEILHHNRHGETYKTANDTNMSSKADTSTVTESDSTIGNTKKSNIRPNIRSKDKAKKVKRERRHKEEVPHQRIRKYNEKYNKDNFGPLLTTNSYLTGLSVLIFSGAGVLRIFLKLSNRPRPATSKEV